MTSGLSPYFALSLVRLRSYVGLRRLSRAQADFHGLAVQQTMVIPRLQLLFAVIDVPVVLVMQVHFLVVAQRPFLMVKPVWQTIEISQLQYALGGLCSCYAGRASLVKLVQVVLVRPCTQVHGQG